MVNQKLSICERENGNIISIIGESSHGKTTFVKLIAGLLCPDKEQKNGRIEVLGRVRWDGQRQLNTDHCTSIAYVFQDFALFPHLTVRQNILFPLRLSGPISSTIETEMGYLLDLLRIQGQVDKYPPQLSGGQKQRVALARALMQNARLMILDEPLASLDQPMRGDIRELLREYARALGLTILSVTHDRQDVLEMSDQVIFLRDGQIWDSGTPRQIFLRPRQLFEARFLGHKNLFKAQLNYPIARLISIWRGDKCEPLPTTARLSVPLQQVRESEQALSLGAIHDVCIPSSWINFQGQNGNGCKILAHVCHVQNLGSSVELNLELENEIVLKATVQDDDFERQYPGCDCKSVPTELVEFSIVGATPIYSDSSPPCEIKL